MTAENPTAERCDIQIAPGRSIRLVPAANEDRLNEQQLADYREHRGEFIEWLRTRGKNPAGYEGYSDYTAYETAYRTARFDRWAWDREDGYTWPPTPGLADSYIENHLSKRDVTNATKGKVEEALARYYRYIDETPRGESWEHEQIWSSSGDDAPRDYLSRTERRTVYETVLSREEYGWKETSLVAVSLDAGLRPVEVNRARVEWIDLDNRVMRIPREDSSKNRENWHVALTDRATIALQHWLTERADRDAYADRDEIWLTREATPYSDRSLARLLHRIFADADISTVGRTVTWYALRHSLGTYLTAERDLKAAKDQLRHKSAQTTMKYDQVPVEDRRDALDDI